MARNAYPQTHRRVFTKHLYGGYPHSSIHYHPYHHHILFSRRSKNILNTDEAQDELVKAARILVHLMDNPNPGLFTWNESYQKAYDKIKDSVLTIEENRR